jgi:hypothetical protein
MKKVLLPRRILQAILEGRESEALQKIKQLIEVLQRKHLKLLPKPKEKQNGE